MRALVPVMIVAILAVTFLIVWHTSRRRSERRATLTRASRDLHEARSVITRLSAEVDAQWVANYSDMLALRGILREYRITDTTDKENTP